jgi:hypothetical protein
MFSAQTEAKLRTDHSIEILRRMASLTAYLKKNFYGGK